ncbi:MAG: sulfotransferase [Deltaproteobacteria bacterium]|nr:sulfotransferase [Deltaproteobacteria bacterium]
MGRENGGILPPQVIQGMTLSRLLQALVRNHLQVDAACLGRLAHLIVLGVFNSIYGGCEKLFNGRDIDSVAIGQPPLFVIGHWRSGTTHLHNLLSCDENLACPTAYQALFPHHFIFSQAGGMVFNLLAPRTRPMDNVAFSSDAPHEDEFALAAMCGVSPYMRVLFPRTGDPGYSELNPDLIPPEALQSWKESLVLFVKKLTLSEGRRAALKSPPHLGRVRTLLEIFPQAQFIHIVRDPYTVYLSTHRLWRETFGRCHLQVPDAGLVDEIILSWHNELFSLFERDRPLIPEGALHEMKFEDLENSPLETLESAYRELGLSGFASFRGRVLTYLSSVSDYRKNEFSMEEATREKVALRWRATFERYGYPP